MEALHDGNITNTVLNALLFHIGYVSTYTHKRYCKYFHISLHFFSSRLCHVSLLHNKRLPHRWKQIRLANMLYYSY